MERTETPIDNLDSSMIAALLDEPMADLKPDENSEDETEEDEMRALNLFKRDHGSSKACLIQ